MERAWSERRWEAFYGMISARLTRESRQHLSIIDATLRFRKTGRGIEVRIIHKRAIKATDGYSRFELNYSQLISTILDRVAVLGKRRTLGQIDTLTETIR